eukprot:5544967-Ditylum_brightwellii.AAC.1
MEISGWRLGGALCKRKGWKWFGPLLPLKQALLNSHYLSMVNPSQRSYMEPSSKLKYCLTWAAIHVGQITSSQG